MSLHFDRDTFVTIGFHLLVLLGVLFAGWSASALVLFYWLETLVIGLWTIILVATARRQPMRIFSSAKQPAYTGIGMALFVLAHAGIFMFVHLFFLQGMFLEDLMNGNEGIVEAIRTLLIDRGLWAPLAAVFVLRGLITFDLLRRGEPVDRPLIGFYFRIVIMQIAIITGGMLVIFLGPVAGLVILVVVRIGFELAVPNVEDFVEAHIDKVQAQ